MLPRHRAAVRQGWQMASREAHFSRNVYLVNCLRRSTKAFASLTCKKSLDDIAVSKPLGVHMATASRLCRGGTVIIWKPAINAVAQAVGRPLVRGELVTAHQVTVLTRKPVRVDTQAEWMRSACAPAACWVQLMSRSSRCGATASGMQCILHARVG